MNRCIQTQRVLLHLHLPHTHTHWPAAAHTPGLPPLGWLSGCRLPAREPHPPPGADHAVSQLGVPLNVCTTSSGTILYCRAPDDHHLPLLASCWLQPIWNAAKELPTTTAEAAQAPTPAPISYRHRHHHRGRRCPRGIPSSCWPSNLWRPQPTTTPPARLTSSPSPSGGTATTPPPASRLAPGLRSLQCARQPASGAASCTAMYAAGGAWAATHRHAAEQQWR